MLFDSCLSNIKLNAQHFIRLMNSDQMWWKDFGNESKLIRRELTAIKTFTVEKGVGSQDSIFTLCIQFDLIVFDRVEKWNRGQKLSAKFANRASIANFLRPCQQTEITKNIRKGCCLLLLISIYLNSCTKLKVKLNSFEFDKTQLS